MVDSQPFRHRVEQLLLGLLLVMGALGLGHAMGPLHTSAAQNSSWTEPVLISGNTTLPWFPDIAVDNRGWIHVVYDTEDISPGTGDVVPGVMYTVYRDGAWSEPNDLMVGGTGNIFRPAVAVDQLGRIHLTECNRGVWYHTAPADEAYSAAAWYAHVLDEGIAYMSDVAVDSRGTVHAVYERWVLLEEPITREDGGEVPGLSDVFYRRSSTGGRTWSVPLNLSQNDRVGSHRVQVKIDSQDMVYVSWDEGWDRWSLHGEPREGVLVFSSDGGHSWSEPTVFSQPGNTNAQTIAASDDRGGVLVVWRATSLDNLFYAWSRDGGQTWSSHKAIPGIRARDFNDTPFDVYGAEADSAGKIHLVAVGLPEPGQDDVDQAPLGVYHLVWNGLSWSAPEPIALYTEAEGFPEYPRIAVSEGNRLHAAWFLRDDLWAAEHRRIWYSSRLIEAPRLEPVPVPTSTATPHPAPALEIVSTSTPLPRLAPGTSQLPQGLYSENDEVVLLAMALSPILLLVALIATAKLRRRAR